MLAALLACGAPDAERAAPSRPVRIDLAASLAVAEQHRSLSAVRFDDPRAQQLLTSGWHRPERDAAGPFAWTSGRSAVVDLPLVARGPLAVRLRVDPFPSSPRLPQQSLRVAWNGEPMGTWTLPAGPEGIGFQVPRERQRVGVNRLELMPSFWARPRSLSAGDDERILGVRCRGIELMGPPEAQAGRPVASAAGDDVRQAPGSVLSWYVALPEAAVLRGRVGLVGDRVSAGGVVHLGVVDRSGLERVLLPRDPGERLGAASVAIEADLSDLADQMVAIHAGFGGAPAAGELVWRALRIEGVKADLPAAREPVRDRYDVLLVLFDSLRADHTEPYGAASVRTPEMARLAARGVTFENATANAPWTSASVASMLTSTYPRVHGLQRFSAAARTPLPGSLPYLPELLRRHGYRTLMVTKNAYVSASFGFARGFDRVDPRFGPPARADRNAARDPVASADAVWEAEVGPFLRADPERPFFAYLHEVEPHSPYEPPEPFASQYDAGYRGHLDALSSLGAHAVLNSDPGLLDPADVGYLNSRYRGEVAWADRYLARMLERLAASGRAARTLVALVSDHGEAFMEHGRLGHGHTVYEEQLRVPLVLSLPGVLPEGRRPRVAAQLVDLPPTLLDLLGLPTPDSMQGRSLLPFAFGDESLDPPHPVFAHGGTLHYDAVRYRHWKLVRDGTLGDPGDAGAYPNMRGFLLFDLARDPEERVDRWADEPVVGPALRQMLRSRNVEDGERFAAPAPVDPGRLDPDVLENLRALGYTD